MENRVIAIAFCALSVLACSKRSTAPTPGDAEAPRDASIDSASAPSIDAGAWDAGPHARTVDLCEGVKLVANGVQGNLSPLVAEQRGPNVREDSTTVVPAYFTQCSVDSVSLAVHPWTTIECRGTLGPAGEPKNEATLESIRATIGACLPKEYGRERYDTMTLDGSFRQWWRWERRDHDRHFETYCTLRSEAESIAFACKRFNPD